MTRPAMYAPTAAYRVGRATENKARAVLHRLGFVTVRSWMSRSPADIVAMRWNDDQRLDCGHELLLIQVKKGGTMSPAERVALLDMARIAGGVPVLCRMESDGTLTFHTVTGTGPRDYVLMEDIV